MTNLTDVVLVAGATKLAKLFPDAPPAATEVFNTCTNWLEQGNLRQTRPDKRVGDWFCKEELCKIYNFAMRTHCRKCTRDKEGKLLEAKEGGEKPALNTKMLEWGQSPGQRLRRTQEGTVASKPYIRKMMILKINLVIDGRTKFWPKNSKASEA